MLKDQKWVLRRLCDRCNPKKYCYLRDWRLEAGPFEKLGEAVGKIEAKAGGGKCVCDWAIIQMASDNNFTLRAFAGTEHISYSGQHVLAGIATCNLAEEIRAAWYGPEGGIADPDGGIRNN